MKKVAIYARYSTDKQNEKSIDDQIAYCKRFIEKQDDMVHTHTFFDKEISGDFIVTRVGMTDLIEHLKKKEFDVVLAENLDRLTRNASDIHKFYNIIRYYDLELYTVNEGKPDQITIGIKGTMNEISLTDTADKVKRAQIEKALKGLFPAGVPYGYKVKTDAVDENGKRLFGVREIDREKAKVIKRIFSLYAEGWGSKKIAAILNAEDIASPSGGFWTSGSILGTKSREVGILSNQAYIGKLIFNKTQRKKHPETGKLRFFPRDKSEWGQADVPSIRIISDDLWQKVLTRRSDTKKSNNFGNQRRTLSTSCKPLTGLVYCGVCDNKAILANDQRYICGCYRMYKKCNNARAVKTPVLLSMISQVIISHIDMTDWRTELTEFCGKVEKNWEEELKLLENKISNLTGSIEMGVKVESIKTRINELEIKRLQFNQELEKSNSKNIILTGNDNKYIRKKLKDAIIMLEQLLTENQDNGYRWREIMSLLVDKVITTPIPDKKRGMTIEVKIAGMEGWAEFYRRITAKRANG